MIRNRFNQTSHPALNTLNREKNTKTQKARNGMEYNMIQVESQEDCLCPIEGYKTEKCKKRTYKSVMIIVAILKFLSHLVFEFNAPIVRHSFMSGPSMSLTPDPPACN